VPISPDIDATMVMMTKTRIWEKRINKYIKCHIKLNENFQKLYSLIFGQCTEFTRAGLEGLRNCDSTKQTFDVIELIKAPKGLTYQFECHQYHAHALHQAKKRQYAFYQRKEMFNATFLETFQTLISVIEQ
jgi:hypothetical protein